MWGAGRQPASVLSLSRSPARLWEASDAGEEPPLPWGSCSWGMSWRGGRSPLADLTWGHWEALGRQERRGPCPGLPRLSPARAACVCPAVPPTVGGPQVSQPRGRRAVARPWASGPPRPVCAELIQMQVAAGGPRVTAWLDVCRRERPRDCRTGSVCLRASALASPRHPRAAAGLLPLLRGSVCLLLGARGGCGERSPPPLAVASTVGCLAPRCPPQPCPGRVPEPTRPWRWACGGRVGRGWRGPRLGARRGLRPRLGHGAACRRPAWGAALGAHAGRGGGGSIW